MVEKCLLFIRATTHSEHDYWSIAKGVWIACSAPTVFNNWKTSVECPPHYSGSRHAVRREIARDCVDYSVPCNAAAAERSVQMFFDIFITMLLMMSSVCL